MENASKALLIAGGMLLVILVLSFAIYMWSKMGSQTANFYNELEQSKIDEFNQSFLKYDVRKNEVIGASAIRKPLTIHDVVSAIYLAKNNNERLIMPVRVSIKIKTTNFVSKTEEDIRKLFDNNLSDKKFFCTEVTYNDLGLVNYMKFDCE